MRDYALIAIIFASLPIGLFRPFYGILVYAWISCMYPHELAWSFAKTYPIAKLSALSVMAGLVLSPTLNFAAARQKENIMMLLLWFTFTISSIFAFYPDKAWYRWQDVSKLIVMSLIASMVIRERAQIRQFVLVIALSLGFYGFKGGIFGIVTGGTQMVMGPGLSVIGANNNLGLALNMCLPLLWYLAREEKGWLKRFLQATAILSIPAIMFTYSRASTYTLAALLLLIMVLSKYRFLIAAALTVGVFLAIPFIPQQWLVRQQTVLTYEEDVSAMSRIDNWDFCWKVALDRPVTGAGFDFQSRAVLARYAPHFLTKYNNKVWDTHNVLFGILTSHGFPGLIAFIMMIGFCLFTCWRLKRKVRERQDLKWVRTYAEMVQLSFVAFLINGMFVNMEYFDLLYLLVSVVATMKIVVARELSEPVVESQGIVPVPVPAAAT
jgi:putative inorganic carbon (hco3(-)) transporter